MGPSAFALETLYRYASSCLRPYWLNTSSKATACFSHVVPVVGLLDDGQRRDDLQRNGIGEQLARKRRARHLRETQLLERLARPWRPGIPCRR